jgi:hypothetical protein
MLDTQNVSGIIMPIIRSTRRDDKRHTVFFTGRAVDEMRRNLRALDGRGYNHSHQVLLMMGMMMPETC